jgi:2-dehydro-3-deoxygluconokinase
MPADPVPSPPAARHHVALLGECMLELQGQAFGTMRQTFGGDTLNTAVYLARCGARTGVQASYVTALGDDGFSSGLLERWVGEGLGVQWVRRLPGRLPGLYLIEVDAQGERRFSYWRDQAAARSLFDTPSTPLEESLDQVDALYFSGISLAILPPPGASACSAAAAPARAGGAWPSTTTTGRACGPTRAEAQAAYARAYALADLAFVTLDDESRAARPGRSGRQLSTCPAPRWWSSAAPHRPWCARSEGNAWRCRSRR